MTQRLHLFRENLLRRLLVEMRRHIVLDACGSELGLAEEVGTQAPMLGINSTSTVVAVNVALTFCVHPRGMLDAVAVPYADDVCSEFGVEQTEWGDVVVVDAADVAALRAGDIVVLDVRCAVGAVLAVQAVAVSSRCSSCPGTLLTSVASPQSHSQELERYLFYFRLHVSYHEGHSFLILTVSGGFLRLLSSASAGVELLLVSLSYWRRVLMMLPN